jgi:transposase InsO family protein
MRKSICGPMTMCQKRAPRSENIWRSTTPNAPIHRLATRHLIRHTSKRCSQPRLQHNKGRYPLIKLRKPVQINRTTSVFRTLNVLDEYSRECLAIRVKRKLNSTDVMDVLTDLFILRGVPAFIRSDNGPEFVAETVRNWINAVGAKTAYIEPGSPWENGYCESFNARFRDELLNGEIFYTLKEAQIIIEKWRRHYNTQRPHSSLSYRPPAPEAIVTMATRPVMH